MTDEPGADYPRDPDATPAFVRVARAALDDYLAVDPVAATELGDHRYDSQLPDLSDAGLTRARRMLSDRLAEVDSVDETALDLQDQIDLDLLRSALAARLFELDEMDERSWNPLPANPGTALYMLLARDFAPLGDRLRSLAGRCRAIPAALELSREQLRDMPLVHLETAITQFSGTRELLGAAVDTELDREPGMRRLVEPAREMAGEAIDEHLRFLHAALPRATGDPRLGERVFEAKLWHTFDAETRADALLVRAESELMRLEEELADLAGGPERVRAALDRAADNAPVDDSTVLPICVRAIEEATEFVVEHDIVTIPDDPVQVIEMPEIHRGQAVAYCDAPGALEQLPLPTFFAVAPAPQDWSDEQVRSFYREYNALLLRDLAVHEAMPGHVLQLAHAKRFVGSTPIRSAFGSGLFMEGWGVYVEEVLALAGFGGPDVRLQQLKVRLRCTINAILDVRVHTRGMTEAEAMTLMTRRGHQEEREAAGKWRRALLSSTQLSTYFAGADAVGEIARDLASAGGRSQRQLHDAMLAHGSLSPRHLRPLLGLASRP